MDKQTEIMQIIVISGDAKSQAYEAIARAKRAAFEESKQILKKARDELAEAHKLQTEMIISTAGEPIPADMLAVHAQDHLMCAATVLDLAEELCELYKTISSLPK